MTRRPPQPPSPGDVQRLVWNLQHRALAEPLARHGISGAEASVVLEEAVQRRVRHPDGPREYLRQMLEDRFGAWVSLVPRKDRTSPR